MTFARFCIGWPNKEIESMESVRFRPEGDLTVAGGLVGGVVDRLTNSGSRSPFVIAAVGVGSFGIGLASWECESPSPPSL
jgi:hypothetical protein